MRREVPSYEAFHWGDKGPWSRKNLWVPDPKSGPITLIGELVDVTYLTTKGRTLAEWNHRFERRRPYLGYCKEGLLILSGDYEISTRGIVG